MSERIRPTMLSQAATAADATSDTAVVSVRRLTKHFPVRAGVLSRTVANVHAVDDVSFDVYPRETLGLVGESGCGKTTVGRCLLRIIRPTDGQVLFEGRDVLKVDKAKDKMLHRDLQMIFQDPYASLDPRMTVGEAIGEGLVIHGIGNSEVRREQVREVMRAVGLPSYYAQRYPHEFSGGQRQRIGIARAVVLRPKFIVCDEPVSALDVSVQSQILNLLQDLRQQYSLTYLFIAHNLAVVKYISDRIVVMYLGRVVEIARTEDLYRNPLHPYTQALFLAIPAPDPALRRRRAILTGDVPSPIDPPEGCRFHTRCPLAMEICRQVQPELRNKGDGHWTACHKV